MKKNNLNNVNIENLKHYLFILENHLTICIHLIKQLQHNKTNSKNKLNHIIKKFQMSQSHENNEGKDLIYQCLYYMDICFEYLLILEKIELNCNKIFSSLHTTNNPPSGQIKYEIDEKDNNLKNIINEDDDDMEIFNIKSDVQKLLNLYQDGQLIIKKENEDIKKELLAIIFMNYQELFYLVNSNSLHLQEYKYFFQINENDIDIKRTKNLIEYIFEDENQKQRTLVLLSFLLKIYDFIEVKKDGLIHNYINQINLEYLQISENSKNYFYSLIDYSSSETKLKSIYNYIECIIYDINMKKLEKKNNCFTKFLYFPQRNCNCINKFALNQFKFWEVLNIVAFIILNIFLLIFYKKSRNEEFEEYNLIDNRKNNLLIKIWPIVHGIILFIIFIYWCTSRLKIDYFYSMIKYTNEYFEESKKLNMIEKAKLLQNPRSDFSYINKFFPKPQEEKIKSSFDERNCFEILYENIVYFYVNYIKVFIYTFKTVYPFIFSFIFLVLSYWSQIFLIIPLFLILNLSENLSSIFLLFSNQALRLFLIAIFFLLILYIFSWIGFFFLPKMFKYEAVDKNNEIIDINSVEENICSSTVPCILYFLNFGFRDNLMEMNLFSFKNETSYYFIQFFFTIFLYAFIHLIFDNIFLATISSAFDEMKEEIDKKDNEIENTCFICSRTRNDCMKENEDFEEHLQKHDIWKYIRYIFSIILKNKDDYTEEEYYVWKQITKKDLDWFPKKDEENSDYKKLIEILLKKNNK